MIGWKISQSIGAESTVDLIRSAKTSTLSLNQSIADSIVSDGGPENKNRKVAQFLTAQNVRRLIARVDIRFSNSMVESLFRMLKSNFLRSEKLRSVSDVERKVAFFFKEHNESIPRANLGGATPREIYLSTWSSAQTDELKMGLENARKIRAANFEYRSCAMCTG